ncbi:MAG: hypothetical protein HQL52_06995 [Magnetococcales bacterium]|nr:hypothetical protein [Magnetococcales bacterium]
MTAVIAIHRGATALFPATLARGLWGRVGSLFRNVSAPAQDSQG